MNNAEKSENLGLTPEEWALHSTGQTQKMGKKKLFVKVSNFLGIVRSTYTLFNSLRAPLTALAASSMLKIPVLTIRS